MSTPLSLEVQLAGYREWLEDLDAERDHALGEIHRLEWAITLRDAAIAERDAAASAAQPDVFTEVSP